MIIRDRAMIYADFPIDPTDYGAEQIQFNIRNVVEAIADILSERGYQTSKLEYEGDHGWTFTVNGERRTIWFQITGLEENEFILIGEEMRSFGIPRKNKTPFHAEVLTQLNAGLAQDARFYKVSWYHDEELFVGFPGEPAPVASDDESEETSSVAPTARPLLDLILSRRKLVKVRPWAEFRADFVPEAINYVGGNVASAIREHLTKPDCSLSQPHLMKDKSWHILVRVRGRVFDLHLAPVADQQFRLFCEPPSWVKRHFSDDYETYIRIVTEVNVAMQSDSRFHQVRWHFRPGDPGAAAPVEED